MKDKKNKFKVKKTVVNINENAEMEKLIKVIISVIVVFLLFYGITYFLTEKEKFGGKGDNLVNGEIKIQHNEILAGQILNRVEKEYFVLVAFENDPYISLYEQYLSIYKDKDKDKKEKTTLRKYNVFINNALNNNYAGDASNFKVDKVTDLKFKETTLLKVKNSKIIEHYEGNEKIVEKLNLLIK